MCTFLYKDSGLSVWNCVTCVILGISKYTVNR
jgi:hypothetical protein